MEKKTMAFQDLINSEIPILVDFTATWCGPCKAMSPILIEVAKEVGDAGKIVKIDIDANQALAEKMGIRGVPTFTLFKNGQELWRGVGMQSKHDLLSILKENA